MLPETQAANLFSNDNAVFQVGLIKLIVTSMSMIRSCLEHLMGSKGRECFIATVTDIHVPYH